MSATRLFLPLLSVLLLAGCGYSGSETVGGYKWAGLYRTDVQTVAVPIFTNRTFQRGAEFKLTKAVINRMEAMTPYKVVDRDRADTILEADITSVSNAPLSKEKGTDIPQEQLLTVRINYTWKDLRNGKILKERKDFDQSVSYYPTLGEGQFYGDQQSVEKIALAIVQDLQADW